MEIIPMGQDFLAIDPFSDGTDEEDFLEIIKCANSNTKSSVYVVSQDYKIANNEYFIRAISDSDFSNVTAPKQLLSKISKTNLNKLNKSMIINYFDEFTESLNDYERIADLIGVVEDSFDEISGIKPDKNCLKVYKDGKYLPAIVRYGRAREDYQIKINSCIILEIISETSSIPKSFITYGRIWDRIRSRYDDMVIYAASKPMNKEVISVNIKDSDNRIEEEAVKAAISGCEFSALEDLSVFTVSMPGIYEADDVLNNASATPIVFDGNDGMFVYPEESNSSSVYAIPCLFVKKNKIDVFFNMVNDIVVLIS